MEETLAAEDLIELEEQLINELIALPYQKYAHSTAATVYHLQSRA